LPATLFRCPPRKNVFKVIERYTLIEIAFRAGICGRVDLRASDQRPRYTARLVGQRIWADLGLIFGQKHCNDLEDINEVNAKEY